MDESKRNKRKSERLFLVLYYIFPILLLTIVMSCLFSIYILLNESGFQGFIWLALGLALALVSRVLTSILFKNVDNLLVKDLDFDNYINFHKKVYSNSRGKRKKRAAQSYYIAQARVEFYKGNFESCLKILDKTNELILSSRLFKFLLLQTYNLRIQHRFI